MHNHDKMLGVKLSVLVTLKPLPQLLFSVTTAIIIIANMLMYYKILVIIKAIQGIAVAKTLNLL